MAGYDLLREPSLCLKRIEEEVKNYTKDETGKTARREAGTQGDRQSKSGSMTAARSLRSGRCDRRATQIVFG
jgi:hypothetical protein